MVLSPGEHREQRVSLPAPTRARIEWVDPDTGQATPVDFLARWTPSDGPPGKGFESAFGSRFHSGTQPAQIDGPSGWYEFQVLSEQYSVHKQRLLLEAGEHAYTLVLERPPGLVLSFPVDTAAGSGPDPYRWSVHGRIVSGPYSGTYVDFEPEGPSVAGTARFRVPFAGTYSLSISVTPGPGLFSVQQAELKAGALTELRLPSPVGF